MNTEMRIIRTEDYRVTDSSGRKLAATAEDLRPCQCCGRKAAKLCIMDNGLGVGSDCAELLTFSEERWAIFGLSKSRKTQLRKFKKKTV